VLELVGRRHGRATIGRADDHPWLFPRGAAGKPLSHQQVLRKLKVLGIRARPARNATLMDLAAELPAVVLSRLLGLHINRATRCIQEEAATGAGYAADLSRRPSRT
jgi:hypothetical protein